MSARACGTERRFATEGSASRVSQIAGTCVKMSYLCSMTRPAARRLAEVARKVGVSEATVSRVLNNKAGVSDSTGKPS